MDFVDLRLLLKQLTFKRGPFLSSRAPTGRRGVYPLRSARPDLSDAALGDELVEFNKGNGVDRILGREDPLRQLNVDGGLKNIAKFDGLRS